jgi:hypothetical protein
MASLFRLLPKTICKAKRRPDSQKMSVDDYIRRTTTNGYRTVMKMPMK